MTFLALLISTLFFTLPVPASDFEVGGIVAFQYEKEDQNEAKSGAGAKMRTTFIGELSGLQTGISLSADIRKFDDVPWTMLGAFLRFGKNSYLDIGAGIAQERDVEFTKIGYFGAIGRRISNDISIQLYGVYQTHSRTISAFDATPLIMIHF